MINEQEIASELEAMRRALVIRNYAQKTINVYVSVLKRYLEQLETSVAEVRPDDIQAWQYHLANELQVSWTLFNQMVCALRFYFPCDPRYLVQHRPANRRAR